MRAPRQPPAAGFPWRGFERPPDGCLFEQLVDLGPPMGVAYERSLRFGKPLHVHDRLLLVFPRSGSAMRITAPEPPRSFDVTSNDVLAVPAHEPHDDHWITEVYDTLALLPSASLLASVAERVGAPADTFAQIVKFQRTPWLDSLVGEYFTDRVLRHPETGPRHAALEELILIETIRLASESKNHTVGTRGVAPGPSSILARALRHLEANLFSGVDLETLAIAAGTSRSSLIRSFRRELDTTPSAYLLGRRLDEAKRLLGTSSYSVGEVAQLVGYENLGAFSEAFRRRFGVKPSSVRRDGDR